MNWSNLLKTLFGSSAESAATGSEGSARNENLSGRAFKQQLEAAHHPVLLDVRTPREYAGGSIPGSLNIDFLSANFSQNVQQLDKNATYFVFCRSGNRSAQACKLMHQWGFEVRNLSGGIGAFPEK
jgi:rhodanese-related sulfurtransferase